MKIEHELNEAIRNILEDKCIKIKDTISYDVGLEHDYNELLEKFKQHIKLIIKINRSVE